MRGHLIKAEQAMVDWHGLNDAHSARAGEDPARRWKNKESDMGLKGAMDEFNFHRSAAEMYATILSAEMAARGLDG